MKTTICFGEIMGRFSPPGYLRIAQAMPGSLEMTFAGAEANAAVAIARLGGAAEFVSALPANPVGAAQRGGLVIYDREGSTFALSGGEIYPWHDILPGAAWLHTTGISAGVSRQSAAATQAAVIAARTAGLAVSCDLNFRRKLWRWESGVSPEALAQRTLASLLPHVDVLIGNAHDIAGTLGERFDEGPGDDLGAQTALAARAAARFPQLQWIAMTLRNNPSASQNKWGALLYRVADNAGFAAPLCAGRYAPYEIQTIVDRVGTGDVFAGALIFALQTPKLAEPARAVGFATAASCLAHATVGDFFQGTRAEVESLLNGDGNGHLSR